MRALAILLTAAPALPRFARQGTRRASLFLLGAVGLLAACGDSNDGGLSNIEEPPEKECIRETAPRTFEIYFVLDVSTSMAPFLNDVKDELVALSLNFPEYDADGRRTRVDYYVVGFVNDYLWFPPGAERMTSHIAVQAAFEDAIVAGSSGRNLTQEFLNAETTENLLDAIASVLARESAAEAKLMLIATDAAFAEAPAVLSNGIEVQSTYAPIKAELEAQGFRVHAFTQNGVDGLGRVYANQPALTTLPGSTVHDLSVLTEDRQAVRDTLVDIAVNAACN
jgi:hypothetical protein